MLAARIIRMCGIRQKTPSFSRAIARGCLSCAVLLATLLSAPSAASITMVEVTEEAGIHFKHNDGRSGRKYYVEAMGSGVGFFDYDNDGYADLYLVNGAPLPGYEGAEKTPTNVLYRNRGDGTFEDVTAASGAGDTGYGHGCAAGDMDNDGDLDLYVTNWGPNVLYRNEGDGTFTDVTAIAGVADDGFGTSAGFADYDLDGDVDLYVANNLEYEIDPEYPTPPFYMGPEIYPGQPDVLYRNNGDGTFTDVTVEAGVHNPEGKGLGVGWADYDNDGDVDLFVSNDSTVNFLYQNNGDGTFEDWAFFAGVGLGQDGEAENGMGTGWGDFDNDGWLDLTNTNFESQTSRFYRNLGDGFFQDVTAIAGLAHGTLPYVGWSTEFVDFDNDGLFDLYVLNGHMDDPPPRGLFACPNQIFRNDGDGKFTETTADAGPAMQVQDVSRGGAVADYDLDGDMDLVIHNSNGPARLLRNDLDNGNNWLGIELVQVNGSPDALGARVTVAAGDRSQLAEVRSGTGYLSQSELRLHFGLGTHKTADLEVRWVNGTTEHHEGISANQFVVITEGRGWEARF